jgi:hypothetical protein
MNVATRDDQQLLLQEKCAEMERLQRAIKRLRAATGTPQQILVKGQMLEVTLTKLREMGTDTEWFEIGYVSGPTIRKLLDAIAEPTPPRTMRDEDSMALVLSGTDR